jgi:hypothetical protein
VLETEQRAQRLAARLLDERIADQSGPLSPGQIGLMTLRAVVVEKLVTARCLGLRVPAVHICGAAPLLNEIPAHTATKAAPSRMAKGFDLRSVFMTKLRVCVEMSALPLVQPFLKLCL